MSPKRFFAALVAAILLAGTAVGQELEIDDAVARTAYPGAPAGAAFMTIRNPTDADDRLVAARSDAAARVELHTHIDAGDGVMQMREAESGFAVPAKGSAELGRGGDHIMFMGIGAPWEDGETVTVTLVFESGAEMTIELPVRIGADNASEMDDGS